jgi:hypothetical protein
METKTAWSHLPNRNQINWVLNSWKSDPNIWNQGLGQTWNQAYFQAYDLARIQAVKQDRDLVWNQAWSFVYDHDPVWNQVRGVLLALIAYDDCDQYLCMTYNELKTWALISEKTQAILLLPMVYVEEQLNRNYAITVIKNTYEV